MKLLRYLVYPIVLFVVLSCDKNSGRSSDPRDSTSTDSDNVRRTYYEDGKIHKEMPYANGAKNGVAKEYYQNGKVFQEVTYVNNSREGVAKRYYNTGILSQETPYENDLMHGVQKRYRRGGDLMAEIPYDEGHLCIGLREYTTDGKLKFRYPEIVITPIDLILKENQYILEVKMSDDSKGVEFFVGKLEKGKYIKEEINGVTTLDGVARIYFSVARGDMRMEEVNIIAKVKTNQSNYYITQKSFHLAVENRF